MSLLIKGMEMPTWCNDCPFNDKEYDVCVATTDRRSIRIPVWERMRLFHREKWCPLIEVPTPHGRLIDADAFISFIKKASNDCHYENLEIDEILTVKDVLDAVISDLDGTSIGGFKNAPTVIEAEEGYAL